MVRGPTWPVVAIVTDNAQAEEDLGRLVGRGEGRGLGREIFVMPLFGVTLVVPLLEVWCRSEAYQHEAGRPFASTRVGGVESAQEGSIRGEQEGGLSWARVERAVAQLNCGSD